MRGTRAWPGALLAVAVVAGVAGLSGCHTSSQAAQEAQDRSSGDAASTQPSSYGGEFLAVGSCSSFGTTNVTEVPCTSERAAARVTARYDGKPSDRSACPATTDFVLYFGGSKPPSGGNRKRDGNGGGNGGGNGTARQGYACMRNLEPPHPGDPGGGGGPRTIVGDCVYGAGKGKVRETACDGKGAHAPQYKVTSAVARRSQCPSSTDLYVQLGGAEPVGCARTVPPAPEKGG